MSKSQETAAALLKGAYDLHIHTAPDFRTRSVDDFEALLDAEKYGMAGIMIKNHYEPTQARAQTVSKYANTKAVAYGGIVLNSTVGGLNPYAVENSLRQGAKMVWLPTMDSVISVAQGKGQEFKNRRAVDILDGDNKLLPAVHDIMDCVKARNVYLATGHLPTAHSLIFLEEALKRGVNVIFTHPDWTRDRVPVDMQVDLARRGVLIEKVFRMLPPEEMCKSICAIGFENCFVTTDRGQPGEAKPVDAMLEYIGTMLEHGISAKGIQTLIRDVPQHIISQ